MTVRQRPPRAGGGGGAGGLRGPPVPGRTRSGGAGPLPDLAHRSEVQLVPTIEHHDVFAKRAPQVLRGLGLAGAGGACGGPAEVHGQGLGEGDVAAVRQRGDHQPLLDAQVLVAVVRVCVGDGGDGLILFGLPVEPRLLLPVNGMGMGLGMGMGTGTGMGMGIGMGMALPPPPRPNTGWFRGQKCGNTGSSFLDKPVLPRGMYHGTHVADISHPDPSKHDKARQHAGIHPRTREHMELQLQQHFDVHNGPFLQPAQSYRPHSLLDLNRKNDGSQERPKGTETRGRRVRTSPCLVIERRWSSPSRITLALSTVQHVSSMRHPSVHVQDRVWTKRGEGGGGILLHLDLTSAPAGQERTAWAVSVDATPPPLAICRNLAGGGGGILGGIGLDWIGALLFLGGPSRGHRPRGPLGP